MARDRMVSELLALIEESERPVVLMVGDAVSANTVSAYLALQGQPEPAIVTLEEPREPLDAQAVIEEHVRLHAQSRRTVIIIDDRIATPEPSVLMERMEMKISAAEAVPFEAVRGDFLTKPDRPWERNSRRPWERSRRHRR